MKHASQEACWSEKRFEEQTKGRSYFTKPLLLEWLHQILGHPLGQGTVSKIQEGKLWLYNQLLFYMDGTCGGNPQIVLQLHLCPDAYIRKLRAHNQLKNPRTKLKGKKNCNKKYQGKTKKPAEFIFVICWNMSSVHISKRIAKLRTRSRVSSVASPKFLSLSALNIGRTIWYSCIQSKNSWITPNWETWTWTVKWIIVESNIKCTNFAPVAIYYFYLYLYHSKCWLHIIHALLLIVTNSYASILDSLVYKWDGWVSKIASG